MNAAYRVGREGITEPSKYVSRAAPVLARKGFVEVAQWNRG